MRKTKILYPVALSLIVGLVIGWVTHDLMKSSKLYNRKIASQFYVELYPSTPLSGQLVSEKISGSGEAYSPDKILEEITRICDRNKALSVQQDTTVADRFMVTFYCVKL